MLVSLHKKLSVDTAFLQSSGRDFEGGQQSVSSCLHVSLTDTNSEFGTARPQPVISFLSLPKFIILNGYFISENA